MVFWIGEQYAGLDLLQSLFAARELADDGVHGCGPDERLRAVIPCGKEFLDCGFKISQTLKGAAADDLAGWFTKPFVRHYTGRSCRPRAGTRVGEAEPACPQPCDTKGNG